MWIRRQVSPAILNLWKNKSHREPMLQELESLCLWKPDQLQWFIQIYSILGLLPRSTGNQCLTRDCWQGSRVRFDWFLSCQFNKEFLSFITPTSIFKTKALKWFLRLISKKPLESDSFGPNIMAHTDDSISLNAESPLKRKAISECRLQDPKIWTKISWWARIFVCLIYIVILCLRASIRIHPLMSYIWPFFDYSYLKFWQK